MTYEHLSFNIYVISLSQPHRVFGISPPTSDWWAMTGSNRRHPACKAGALPAELITRGLTIISIHKNVQCVKGFFYFYRVGICLLDYPLIRRYFFLFYNIFDTNGTSVFCV